MALTIKNLIAEVKTELSQYDNSGLLDDISLRLWAKNGLKEFGNLVTELTEKTLEVKNGKTQLPESFYSLYLAAMCQPKSYTVVKGNEDDLVNSFFYRIRTEATKVWNNMSHKFEDGEQYKEVCEKIYLNNGETEVDFYYGGVRLLRLVKGMNREFCSKGCKNLVKTMANNPHEINIIGNYIQTNFKDGYIYIQYHALPSDENGDIIIPEISNNKLFEYLSYTLKRRSLEMLWLSDNEDLVNKVNWLLGMERQAKMEAMTALKIDSISGHGWWRGVKKMNESRVRKFSNFIV